MNIFRRLRWQLTLSYTVVTVCALLVVTLVLGAILVPRIFLPNNVFTPEGLAELLITETPSVWSPILSESPVNTTLIDALIRGSNPSIIGVDFLRIGDIQFNVRTLASVRVLVIGADKTLLGLYGEYFPHHFIVGRPIEIDEINGLEEPFNAAMSGIKDPKQLYTEFKKYNQLLITIPVNSNITGEQDRIVGVVAIFVDSFPTQRDVPRNILLFIGRFLLIFLVGAGAMGTIFGVLTASGLSRRFKRLSTVTEHWSKGDFSTFIEDKTGDEISQFAHKLDDMARQTQSLMHRRQAIAVSEERNRLARDLHDSAKQQALAASFELGTSLTLFDSDPQGAKKHLVEADNLVDTVRKELTNLVHELRPQSLEGQEYSEIINEYASDWSQRSEIEIDIKVNIHEDEQFSLEKREMIFRIIQEALANIARHSGAKQAKLILESAADSISLTIQDDGQGFDPNVDHIGLGLRSMRERAEGLGGSFVLKSAPGQGVTIIVKMPIEKSIWRKDV